MRHDCFAGSYLHYGVREHAMAAAMNGIALHGGFIPYGGTFLTFADYSRPAIRLAALMGIRVIHVMTHDSIGLGEDGPTHQPVEHLASLRAIPNLLVFRPGDAVETAEAWDCALQAEASPSVLCLSRQALPSFRDATADANQVARGAYVLVEPPGRRDVTLIATGSEVSIALEAATLLAADQVQAAVVSAPCLDLFRLQPPRIPRICARIRSKDRRRSRRRGRLGALDRRRRRVRRHGGLRRIRSGRDALPRIRHYRGSRCRGGPALHGAVRDGGDKRMMFNAQGINRRP